MSKKYRVGIIGFAHMHINNVASLYAQHLQVELVAGADTVPDVPELREAPYTRAWNVKNALDNIGLQKAYDDLSEINLAGDLAQAEDLLSTLRAVHKEAEDLPDVS